MENMSVEGHKWNRDLERQYYFDNVEAHGVEVAKELSRTNARTFRNEKMGIASLWDLRVSGTGDMVMIDAKTKKEFPLLETAQAPYTSSRSHLVSDEVRETANLEIPTLQVAVKSAAQGARLIIFPEQHGSKGEESVVRYFTVWEQDGQDSKLYHGNRIDLGTNVNINDARKSVVSALVDDNKIRVLQDEKHHEAFVMTAGVRDVSLVDVQDRIITALSKNKRAVSYMHDQPLLNDLGKNILTPTSKDIVEIKKPVINDQVLQNGTRVTKLQPVRKYETGLDINGRDYKKPDDGGFRKTRISIFPDVTSAARFRRVFFSDKNEGVHQRNIKTVERKSLTSKLQSVTEIVQNQHRIIHREVKKLTFIIATRVGFGSVPGILESLRRTPVKEIVAVEKSIARRQRKELKKRKRSPMGERVRLKLRGEATAIEKRAARKRKKEQKKLKGTLRTFSMKTSRKDRRVLPSVGRTARRLNLLVLRDFGSHPKKSVDKIRRKRIRNHSLPVIYKDLRIEIDKKLPVSFLSENIKNKWHEALMGIGEVIKKRKESHRRRQPDRYLFNRKLINRDTPPVDSRKKPDAIAGIQIRNKNILKSSDSIRKKYPDIQPEKTIEFKLCKILYKLQSKIRRLENKNVSPVRVSKNTGLENFRKSDVRKNVVDFSLLLTFYILFNYQNGKIRDKHPGKEEPADVKVAPEETGTPWVLLAIIRYLAMLREQGSIRPYSNKQKKRKKQRTIFRQENFPGRGVIFAYGS